MQLAEVLTQEDYHTLHSDGTTKFGHKYLAYQVSTEHETYTLGMWEVASGSAHSMKEILDDLSVSASTSSDKNAQVASEIVARIKSTMSDRASTEKSFNKLWQITELRYYHR